jgi:hypothetical protein
MADPPGTTIVSDPAQELTPPWRRGTCVDARLGSPWIRSHNNIRVPTAALEAAALASLLFGRPRD